MKSNLRQIVPVLLAAALSAVLVFPAAGASVVCTTVHAFGLYTNGASPYCVLALGNDGNLYGTTSSGGSNNAGTVFRVTTNGAVTQLYSFTNGLDGSAPQAGLTLGSDGGFYGTAQGGGSNDAGTVFRITPSGNFTALYSFSATDMNGNNPDGAGPVASLVQGNGGLLYGTASVGGTNGWGAVFQISTNGAFSALYSFSDDVDGALPIASLAPGNDGYLYGAASSGGSNGYGTIFKLASAKTFTALYSFTNGTDGASPAAGLALAQSGVFYGMASEGGAYAKGTVFTITSAGAFSPLYSFTNGKDGGNPVAALIQGSDLNLYGTTTGPSSGFGTIFEMSSTGSVTPLYSFTDKADGAYPQAGLVQDTDGTLYGTAASGLTNAGTIFKVTTNGVLTPLAPFLGGFDGENPLAPVLPGGDGSFYGTTFSGGSNGQGVVFQLSPNGNFVALHSFTNGADGSAPVGLAPANDGSFYGVTAGGGTNFAGAVFHLTTDGALAAVHSFKAQTEGGYPLAGLVQGNDGFFYGTTSLGGPNGSTNGTVFKVSAAGAVTLLHAFTNGMDGADPVAPLVQGLDGNFYGTTYVGGSNGYGNVFQISSNGASFVSLHAFTNGMDGANPKAGLVQGLDGSFYGATYFGGLTSNGAIFKITSTGLFTPLYSFTGGADGANPAAGLMQYTDTNFYGTTYYGGLYTQGVVFRITPAGSFITLHSFSSGMDGANPAAGLTSAPDGSIYGTTYAGGLGTMGTVFRLTGLGAVAPLLLSIVQTAPGLVLTWSAVPGQTYQLQFTPSLSPANWTNLGNPVSTLGETASQTNLFPFNPPRFYRVSTALPTVP